MKKLLVLCVMVFVGMVFIGVSYAGNGPHKKQTNICVDCHTQQICSVTDDIVINQCNKRINRQQKQINKRMNKQMCILNK